MIKCYEMMKLPVLFHIFREVEFPLRLGWMLIQSYIALVELMRMGLCPKRTLAFKES